MLYLVRYTLKCSKTQEKCDLMRYIGNNICKTLKPLKKLLNICLILCLLKKG